jgi:hypothetical protein
VPRPEDAVTQDLPTTEVARVPGAGPLAAETWLRIVQVHDRITHRVDSALHRQHAISLTGFEALRRIAEAPGERATMGEVAEGLVVRERAADDRRLMHARLTPAGRALVAEATPTHDGLVAHLLALLGDDAAVVTDALARVSAAARIRR